MCDPVQRVPTTVHSSAITTADGNVVIAPGDNGYRGNGSYWTHSQEMAIDTAFIVSYSISALCSIVMMYVVATLKPRRERKMH